MTWAAPFMQLGAATVWLLRLVGAISLVFGRTLLHVPRLSMRELMRALALYGFHSLPLTLGVASLIGATVVMQAGVYANNFGARQYTGWAAGYSVLWEFGPLLLGLVMAARIGARNAAELALLEVNGQIEGLRGISLDPFALLVAPRVVASTISVTALSVVTFFVAVLWQTVAAYFSMRLPVRVFLNAFEHMVLLEDAAAGVTKSFAFGLAIALVSTAAGLRATGGARGVGAASARAVVWSCAGIFLLDAVLTPLLAEVLS